MTSMGCISYSKENSYQKQARRYSDKNDLIRNTSTKTKKLKDQNGCFKDLYKHLNYDNWIHNCEYCFVFIFTTKLILSQ